MQLTDYQERNNTLKNIFEAYIDDANFNVCLTTMVDEFGQEHSLGEVQSNIIQVCLLNEGIGLIARAMGPNFQELLLKALYPILEKAGWLYFVGNSYRFCKLGFDSFQVQVIVR